MVSVRLDFWYVALVGLVVVVTCWSLLAMLCDHGLLCVCYVLVAVDVLPMVDVVLEMRGGILSWSLCQNSIVICPPLCVLGAL